MSDFKEFLDKVLAPIGANAGAEPAQVTPAPESKTGVRPEAVGDDELERRYIEVMNALFADAQAREAMHVFADVVTWKLAVLAYHWGPKATGDVIRRIGAHLAVIADAAEAQREADAAKDAGHRPN